MMQVIVSHVDQCVGCFHCYDNDTQHIKNYDSLKCLQSLPKPTALMAIAAYLAIGRVCLFA